MGRDYSRAHPMRLDADIPALAGQFVQLSSSILDEVNSANLFGRTLQLRPASPMPHPGTRSAPTAPPAWPGRTPAPGRPGDFAPNEQCVKSHGSTPLGPAVRSIYNLELCGSGSSSGSNGDSLEHSIPADARPRTSTASDL